MDTSTPVGRIPVRDLAYYRRRLQNNVFGAIYEHFAAEATARGLTKGDIARRLGKDPSQVTRWLSAPSNLTLETISDILLALDAEPARLKCLSFRAKKEPAVTTFLVGYIEGRETTGVTSPAKAQFTVREGKNLLGRAENAAAMPKVAVR